MLFTNELKSNLIDKPYTYKSVNLLELRKTIMEQENINTFDILAGYHKLSELKMHYDYEPMFKNDEERQMIVNILKQVFEYLKKIKVEKAREDILKTAKEYQSYFAKKFGDTKFSCQNLSEEHYVREILDSRIKNAISDKELTNIFEVNDRNRLNVYNRYINEYSFVSNNDDLFFDKCFEYAEPLLKPLGFKLEQGFFGKNDCHLPDNIKVDNIVLPDFDNVVFCYENNKIDSNEIVPNASYYYREPLIIDEDGIYIETSISCPIFTSVSKMLDKETAKDLFEKAFLKGINACVSMSPMQYYQELESTPISINITKDGKIQLIDGYKRLLYVSNENLLNRNVTIRVFEDLTDVDILALLFAENSWKTINSSSISKTDFHDRGFLFCLKQRFGIEYSTYLFDVLFLYDHVGSPKTWAAKDALTHCSKSFDIRETALFNYHFIDDIKVCEEFLKTYKNVKTPYADNIKEFVAYSIIIDLGGIRRQEKVGKKLTIDMLYELLNADYFVKAFNKKKYSNNNTYIANNFRDNKLDEELINSLSNMLGYNEEN